MLNLVKNYCEKILTTTKCKELSFHNIEHTREVVENVLLIGKHLDIPEEELEIIKIAAWFHDTGFCETYKGHEEVSIRLAKDFLVKENYANEKIEKVVTYILATKMPQNPLNKYAEVLSDADIFHVSTCSFFYRKLLLRREWEMQLSKFSSDKEWHLLNLEFLQKHQFFTSYGKDVLMKGQLENEEKVRNLIKLYQD